MQPLNAIDAIAPAFTRTHQTLFAPFRVGRSWKLAVSQYIGLIGALFIPFPLILVFIPGYGRHSTVPIAPLAIISCLLMLVGFVFFYFGVRMQFVAFEMILTRAQFIAPMWRRYSSRVWPVIGFKVALGTVLGLLAIPLFLTTGKRLFMAMASMPQVVPGQPPDPRMFQMFFSQIIGFYAVIFCAFLFFKAFSTTFEDFVLPFYILETITLPQAFRRGLDVLIADPLHCILYLILKLILSIIGFIMQYISNLIVAIPIVIVAVIAGAIGLGFGAAMHGGPAGHLLLFAGAVLLYLICISAMIWYQTLSLGYLSALLEAYAIYFLAGRYPLLGNLLEPGPSHPFTPPPVFPSPEEQNDDDGGPPLPLDPAIA